MVLSPISVTQSMFLSCVLI